MCPVHLDCCTLQWNCLFSFCGRHAHSSSCTEMDAAVPAQPDAAETGIAEAVQLDEPPGATVAARKEAMQMDELLGAANAARQVEGLARDADMAGIDAVPQDLYLAELAAAGTAAMAAVVIVMVMIRTKKMWTSLPARLTGNNSNLTWR